MQPRRLLACALVMVVAGFIWTRRHAVFARLTAPPRLASVRQATSVVAAKVPGSPLRLPMVPSVDGNCPETHPVKGNPTSRIYHLPHQRAYHRLHHAVCFIDAASAEADGYRASKQ